MRRDEIARRIREAERGKIAALRCRRRRQRATGRIARHVAKRGSVAPAGADEKAVGAVGANERLLSGQTERRVLPHHSSARREWVVAVGAFFECRNDECRARHYLCQHWMRRAPQPERSCRDRRKTDWLADEPAPGLFKHQRELGEAQTEAIHRTRNEDAEPPQFPRLPQPCRREARILPAKSTRHFWPRRRDEFGGAVAQQRLLRCQMQLHAPIAPPVNLEGSRRGGRGRCAGSPMSRRRLSRDATEGTPPPHPPRRNCLRSARPPARGRLPPRSIDR